MCRRMRVLCRVWQRRNKRVGGADDERIIIDRSWLSACKQRCTEPVPWNLSIPWSIKNVKQQPVWEEPLSLLSRFLRL